MDIDQEALLFHKSANGKVVMQTSSPIRTTKDLSLSYTPGVAVPSKEIANNPEKVWEYTGRRNRVAIITDGSAVLGLGDIGPEAALPVMEGKAALFKEFADVDAFPICLAEKDTEEIIKTVKRLAPSFGGINLEDISAPRCFEIEEVLKEELDIPVFHDDQHGSAIVVLAGLMNALKVKDREQGTGNREQDFCDCRIVISGAGAAGTAIARILLSRGFRNILILDSKGIINRNRDDLNSAAKAMLAAVTNPENIGGSLADALNGADIFIGVSRSGLVTKEMVSSMNKDPIIFALANPDPEIMPSDARDAGAKVVATGRSDFPNQVNNVLAFPGVFRGALDARATDITEEMKLAAADALAACVPEPSVEKILPDPLDHEVASSIADAVKSAS